MTILPIGPLPRERVYAVKTMRTTALLTTRSRHVTKPDPRFAYMRGWEMTAVRVYAHKRGWRIAEVVDA